VAKVFWEEAALTSRDLFSRQPMGVILSPEEAPPMTVMYQEIIPMMRGILRLDFWVVSN
jgi:hypothetical protein